MDPVAIADEDQAAVLQAKVVTMVVLFAASMLCGTVPMLISLKFDWLTKSDDLNSNRLVVGLLAFGGGVLFATAFMHLLPELDANIKILQELGQLPEMQLYLAALITCAGFFMMYLVNELVLLYIDSRRASSGVPRLSGTLSVRSRRASSVVAAAALEPDVTLKEVKTPTSHDHTGMLPHTDGSGDSVVSALRGLLIVLALSIHELFEGLAVGLESSASNVWYMFGAVSAHKYLIAFCIGVELLASKTKTWLSLVYVFTFSFMSALGIGIGILLVGGSGASEAGLYSVVLQGLACGTLVYVVFFEVLRQERGVGLLQFVCSLLGFTCMVGLELLIGH